MANEGDATPSAAAVEARAEQFPSIVLIRSVPPVEGLAVSLVFHMARKNNFSVVAFLSAAGTVSLSSNELLRWFDDEARLFIMDYADPRSDFSGRVVAHVMNNWELERALGAYGTFHKYTEYPAQYEERLKSALHRGQSDKTCDLQLVLQ